jgi:hypothetical protein
MNNYFWYAFGTIYEDDILPFFLGSFDFWLRPLILISLTVTRQKIYIYIYIYVHSKYYVTVHASYLVCESLSQNSGGEGSTVRPRRLLWDFGKSGGIMRMFWLYTACAVDNANGHALTNTTQARARSLRDRGKGFLCAERGWGEEGGGGEAMAVQFVYIQRPG